MDDEDVQCIARCPVDLHKLDVQQIPRHRVQHPQRIDPDDPEDIFAIKQRHVDAAGIR